MANCNDITLGASALNGFVFTETTPQALLATLKRVVVAWSDRARWHQLQRNHMHIDYSWWAGDQCYCDLYRALIAAA